MHEHVELLGAEDDAGYAADEAEHDEREEHAGEGRVAPGCLGQPLEPAAGVAVAPLRRLDRARDREAVDHRAEHRKVHHVAGVDDLPA